MALFKISKGLKANLPSAKTAGNCWYTVDDSLFYIDYEDENGEVQRKALNAKDAETLSGASLAAILTDNELEVPTSKAVLDAIASYDSIPTTHVVHGESQELLSDIIETYILNIDYSLLTFDTSEIVFDESTPPGSDDSTTSKLGYAVLGKMVLG